MKKIFFMLAVIVGSLTAQAGDYPYLTFETTDGAKVSVAVDGLTLTVSGTTLTAGSQQFIIANLSKMYFSTSDETATGIEEMTSATLDEAAEIYDLQGHKVERLRVGEQSSGIKAQMHKGVYIVKTKSKAYKMIVK